MGFVWFGVAIQGKFFAYHYATALPFVALLTVAALWGLVERVPRGAASWALRGVLVVGVPVALLLEKPPINPGADFWARARMRLTAIADRDSGKGSSTPFRAKGTWTPERTGS